MREQKSPTEIDREEPEDLMISYIFKILLLLPLNRLKASFTLSPLNKDMKNIFAI